MKRNFKLFFNTNSHESKTEFPQIYDATNSCEFVKNSCRFVRRRLFQSSLFVFLFLLLFLLKLNAESVIPFFDPLKTISMDFKDAGLKDVLKALSIQSGLNFIAAENVQDRQITLYLDRVPLKNTMDNLFKANNLDYELDKDSNTFIVKDWGKLEVETVTKVFALKYATVSSSSLKEEMASYIKSGTTGGTTGGGGGTGKWKIEEDTGITIAVKKLLSQYGSVIEDFRTNSLIVTDTPSRIKVISQLIASLDVRVPQVLLEVEMLDVSKNTVDKLGVNWPTTLLQFTVPGSRETRFPFGKKGTSGQGRSIDPALGVFGGTTTKWDFGAWNATHFGPSILTVIGATLTLDFLRSQTDTKFLARPRLLTLNNETAEIRIATNESIGITTTTTEETTSATPERTETGVVLRVTPQINLETGEITMFIYPKVAEAVQGNTLTSGSNSYQYRDPEERSTKSIVRVKDGDTVVVGGLIRNEKTQVVTKLPILGDLPIVGALFRHKGGDSDKDRTRELMVFITPRIIKEGMELSQAKKPTIPAREQGTTSGIKRELAINAGLNSFERKKK